ncbi:MULTISPECIES: porin family protein [Chryseobacterium]|uniref:porin family protein n=1 Tax=Chryseobacterium TaxID=59732 RepID=UPI001295358F|nr:MULTISPECIES: porin family protein [Chryseobacterium]MDR6921236.1 hypothetical protein [Chryseobacterium sp. 2987]
MNNRWLNDLRSKMEDHEEDVPDGLWEDIRDELFSEKNENIIPVSLNSGSENGVENKNMSVGSHKAWLYRIAGIAAAVVLLFFTGKLLLEMNAETTESRSTANSGKKDQIANFGRESGHSEVPDTAPGIKTADPEKFSVSKGMVTGKNIDEKVQKNTFESNINKEISEEKRNVFDLRSLQNKEIPGQNYVLTPKEEKEKIDEVSVADETSLQEKYVRNDKSNQGKQHSKRSWMLSMLTGNASSNSSVQQFSGYASMSGNPMIVDEVWSATSTEDDPLTEILLANQSKEVEARIRHKIPVTFGLSLYYNLGKRWGVGTGVNYTKLSSELHSGTSSNYIKGEQTVHYIGIPVQINYNVVKKGRFTGYVTGGMIAEKPVAGSLKTKYIVNDEVKETSEERLDSKPIQFSVNTAAGLQLKVIDKFGIYAEPGIGYHFKDNSGLNTIYKEKPLHFNVKFGVRLLLD